jgi:hypothetical protein
MLLVMLLLLVVLLLLLWLLHIRPCHLILLVLLASSCLECL